MSSHILQCMCLCILSLFGKETPSIQEFRVRRCLCTANSGQCAPDFDDSDDEPLMHCPAGMRFKDWVMQLRGGRNTIEITTY
jgi:hypothetical protein